MLPLISPTGQKVSGVNDAADQPFWFNGQDQVGFTPVLAAGTFGKKLSFNGSKRIISGLPLGDKLKPITVTFKKTGKFTYYCNIHAGMKGTVIGQGQGQVDPVRQGRQEGPRPPGGDGAEHVQEARQHAGAGRHDRRRRGGQARRGAVRVRPERRDGPGRARR